MFAERLSSVLAELKCVLAGIEPDQIPGPEAVALVDHFTAIKNVAVAGCTLAARRVEQTKAWHGAGYLRMSDWMAAHTGTTTGSAIAILETGRRLESLPATRDAFVTGGLSDQQAQHVTAAAAANPGAEKEMLEAARKGSVNALRLQSQQVIAAACTDVDEDQRRHRSRFFRIWRHDDMIHVQGKFTMDAGAKLMASVVRRTDELMDAARAAGSTESRDAYAADALISVITDGHPGPKAMVNVLVDYDAIQRGELRNGERCAVPGVGPVSVESAKRLAEEGVIRLLLTEGADVRSVVTLGQTVTPKQQAALEARDPVCVVPGCNETKNLENHHWTEPYIKSRRTRLCDLCRVCHWHHLIITHRGWRLVGGPGKWQFLPPADRGAIPRPHT